eukprot:2434966-Prymnesium_polylepis.1
MYTDSERCGALESSPAAPPAPRSRCMHSFAMHTFLAAPPPPCVEQKIHIQRSASALLSADASECQSDVATAQAHDVAFWYLRREPH